MQAVAGDFCGTGEFGETRATGSPRDDQQHESGHDIHVFLIQCSGRLSSELPSWCSLLFPRALLEVCLPAHGGGVWDPTPLSV